MPRAGSDGWSYKYNVFDTRANAENAAHIGDRGFIAVFAVAPSGDATGAVSIVATTPDGYVAQIILEFFTDPDDIDFEVAEAAWKAIRAAVRAIKEVYPRPAEPSATPSPSTTPSPSPTETESPSPSETPEPTPPGDDGTDRTFAGPGSKSESCRRLEELVMSGRDGIPRRGVPDRSRPPADPRAAHARDDSEGAPSSACQSDAQPRVCGAEDCGAGLHLDPTTCQCSRARSFEADPALGCAAVRCAEGTHGEALGLGCVCASDEGRDLARPLGPLGPGGVARGWGFRLGRPEP